jgi:hypothetical protein
MPLLALWKSNPNAIGESTIEQIVAIAGDGSLKDGSHCSLELRDYLAQIPSSKISDYVEHCLSSGFAKSGMVLQDLINELGRRLDYHVTNGRYQGTSNTIGFDGIWISEGHTIIAEVKTTDAFRISLDTIASYRARLQSSNEITASSSILIVVGRGDTGELEAQIRGSRHAWDIRLISADALLKLVQLKEDSDDPETGRKIRSLLAPMEYTRLDKMVDVMFTTAKDVEAALSVTGTDKEDSETDDSASEASTKAGWEFTDFAVLDQKRGQIVNAVAEKIGSKLIKKSRALFWDATHEKRIACTVSKRYVKRTSTPYWYAYHPAWDDFLGEGKTSFFVLGCMDLSFAFAIPLKALRENLSALNTTTTERGTYWHIHLVEKHNGDYAVLLPKRSSQLPLTEYRINLAAINS